MLDEATAVFLTKLSIWLGNWWILSHKALNLVGSLSRSSVHSHKALNLVGEAAAVSPSQNSLLISL